MMKMILFADDCADNVTNVHIFYSDISADDHQYNRDDHQRCRCCSVAPKCWLVGPHFQLTQRFTVTSQPQIAKQNSKQIFKYLY